MPVSDLSRIFKAYDVRGIYGPDIDGDVAEAIGRGLARALGDLAGKAVSELRIGLGRDMRLSAPELTARYRAGMAREGAHVVDAGMVGTEMLYWLVGSRDLDGGLMCTASHNPKADTGAKMVEGGSGGPVGSAGSRRSARTWRTGSARPPAAARARRSTSTRTSRPRPWSSSTRRRSGR